MRAVLLAALLTACNDTVISRGSDLAGFVGNSDMAGGRDLALPPGQKYGCNGFVGCYTDCFNTNPSATAASCQSTCSAKSQAGVLDTFNAALGCGQMWCLDKGGTVASYRCKLSGTSLVNADGTQISDTDPADGSNPQKACGACLSNALANLFGDTCAGTVDCNPSACSSSTNACLSDLP